MPIIEKSDTSMRRRVMDYLRAKRLANPSYRVLDVGGAKNPWCDDLVDAYVDMNEVASAKKLILGNLLEEATWKEIGKTHWDFSICTHTLEDLRDPLFVMRNLLSVSSAGFIAVPNKHVEFSHVESAHWVGYAHHRWIFTLDAGKVRLIGKFPVANYFSSHKPISHLVNRVRPRIIEKIRGKLNLVAPGPGLPWLDATKTGVIEGMRMELGFLWETSFDFEVINGDYVGDSTYELADLYRNSLAKGL